MKRASLSDRLRYAFDNFMSRGTVALIGGLGVLSLVVILVAASVVTLTGAHQEEGAPLNFFEAAWASLMRTLDAGTMGSDTGWGFRLIMFGVTLGGVFIISTLIGVLTSGIEGKLDELRKGRSHVIEEGHTIILGWSEQVFTLVSELTIANANQRHPVIVILGEEDKVQMEDEIRARVGDTGRTRVVCRTGNPMEPTDLDLVSLHTSRSIIILATDEEEPDSQVIKTILAIVNHPNRRPEPYHIVAAIRDPRNWEVAKMVGRDEVELVLTRDLIARIIAQTCRQSGLSTVYTELLDFGGDEIYFASEPGLTGRTFGEALLAYEDSALIGLCKNGTPMLNPPMETLIEPGDQVIAISEDDDTVRLSGKSDLGIDESAIQTPPPIPPTPERTLILGWNRRAPAIVSELDRYVPSGSEVTVVTGHPYSVTEIAGLQNQTLSLKEGETTDRRVLDSLGIEAYDRVVVLCYDGLDPQRADARTLITLLHLRDIAEHASRRFSIVSEMLDVRNRDLAEATHADDFIVSDRLVSLMMAQISENKALNVVLSDIFDPEGSEIYLKPAAHYVKTGVPVNFYTVVEAARRRGQAAIGYRLHAQANDAARSYGVVINPDKSQPITFAEQDRIIVVAEE